MTSLRVSSSLNASIARDASEVYNAGLNANLTVSKVARTIGRECCFSSDSWLSHSAAMSDAASILSFGMTSGLPDGVLSGRLSSVTASSGPRAEPADRVAMSTLFQNRLRVASAPTSAVSTNDKVKGVQPYGLLQ